MASLPIITPILPIRQQALRRQVPDGVALAFNVFNLETAMGVVDAALQSDQPIYIQTSASTVRFYAPERLSKSIFALIPEARRDKFILHLDHCDDLALIDACIEVGWDSVMIDASAYSLKENIERTSRVVRRARQHGVLVEGEIGQLGGDAEDGFGSGCAAPVTAADCKEFIESTEVDLAAVAVGNQHGFYQEGTCNIDVSLLQAVHQLCPDTALVLHGGSGIPADQLADSVRVGGVRKINFSTDIKEAYLNGVEDHLSGPSNQRHDMSGCVQNTVSSVRELAADHLALLKRISMP